MRLRSVLGPSLIIAGLALYITWLGSWINHANTATRYIAATLLGLENLAWLPWFLLYLAAAYLLIFLLTLYRTARKRADQPWFTGLYGAAALSILTGLFLLILVWLLQAEPANRASGQLVFFSWLQPWWSLLTTFSIAVLIVLLITGQLGKYIYDRLVRSAVREERLSADNRLLDKATVMRRVETLWNLIRNGFDVTRVNPDLFGQAETVSTYEELSMAGSEPQFKFSAQTTAEFIMVRTDQQRDEETSRLRILRVMSIVVGLVLAYLLQIDVLALLGEAFPGALESLNVVIINGETLHAWRSWLPPEKAVTVGIVLTAFAASAGSAFWHDRLDKLQASKKGAQAAAALLNQASQVTETISRQ